MRPTFGDTRPTFGIPSPAVRDGREPERPSIGVQLGMDGTELPALSEYHAHPFWLYTQPCTRDRKGKRL